MDKIKLTVSILVSNRPDTVRKCLDSIQPLLNAVSSELIVTDTGCDEHVRKLIEEYSSNIIDFTWCADFSAARNEGLRRAKGEWFLYIDDDEWFDDVSGIIEFMKSKESNQYTVACYTQRNYLDFTGKEYVDHVVDRILRITPELHFEHRIHEAYTGIDIGVKKRINDFVHHYGYVYKSKEERIQKYKRNQTLLELECEENPNDMRMQYQLVTNVISIEDWEAAILYANRAIDRESDSEYWDACHAKIIYCYLAQEKWYDAIYYAKKYLDKNLYDYDRFGITEYMTTAYWHLERYNEAMECAIQGVEVWQTYLVSPEKFNRNQLMRTEYFENDEIKKMLAYGMDAAIHEGKIGECIKLLQKYPYSDVLQEADRFLICKIVRSLLMGHSDLIEVFWDRCKNKEWLTYTMGQLQISCKEMDVSQVKKSVGQILHSLPFYRYQSVLKECMAYMEKDNFDYWESIMLSCLQQDSFEELWWFIVSYDWKLTNFNDYVEERENVDIVNFAVELLSCYAEVMVCYCQNIYSDEMLCIPENNLNEKEQVAFFFQQMVSSMEQGKLHEGLMQVRKMASLVPEWKKAWMNLMDWICQVSGN